MLPSLLASPIAHKSQKYFWKCCSRRLRKIFNRAFLFASSCETIDYRWQVSKSMFFSKEINKQTSIAASKSVQLTRPSLFVSEEEKNKSYYVENRHDNMNLIQLPSVFVKNRSSFFKAVLGILSRGIVDDWFVELTFQTKRKSIGMREIWN